MGEWMPIETAPHGERLLLYKKESSVFSGYKTIDGWWALPWAFTSIPSEHPTHWQPLPAPPCA